MDTEVLGPTRTPDESQDGGLRTADHLVGILAEAGVEVVFGIPGGTIAPLFDALIDRPSIRVIHTRHEAGAMFAAAGYARMTGKLAVVLVTSGPGVINAFTGLASAHCDGLPVMLIAGEVSLKGYGRHALQEGTSQGLNIVGMGEHICKLALEVPTPEAAPAMMKRAIATALSGRPGPVLLTLPIDVSSATTASSTLDVEVSTTFSIPQRAVDEVAAAFAVGARNVIFAGSGVRNRAGAARLLELAEHTQTPVITTPKGKGIFPEDHPLSLGVFGLGGHPSATAYLEGGVDSVLAIGSSLGDIATNAWSKLLQPTGAMIHVDIDARQFGRNYRTSHNIVAPADDFLARLRIAMPPAAGMSVHGVTYHSNPSTMVERRGSKIAPQRALWELQQVMPACTIYTVDSGEHFLFAVHYLRCTHPDGFVAMSGLGSMGSGIGSALGVKLARPERPVVVICGDGGFAMAASEVSTAVAEKLPIVFVVMNDERLGMVELGHQALYRRSPQFATGPLSVGRMASALGAQPVVVNHPGQILDLRHLATLQSPVVLDVQIDPTERMPKNGRFEALGNTTRKARMRLVN